MRTVQHSGNLERAKRSGGNILSHPRTYEMTTRARGEGEQFADLCKSPQCRPGEDERMK